MSVNIQTGNRVTIQSGNRVLISAPGPQGAPGDSSGGTPGGSDTQVQFNDGGSFGGNSALTFDKTTGVLTASHIHGALAGNLYAHVKNTSGGTLAKGTPVYATGSVGVSGTIEIAAADYTNAAKMPAIGIIDTELAVNAEGNAVVVGEIAGLATDSYAINQELFVGTNGLLDSLPTSGQAQSIAVVSRVHASTGIVVVNAQARLNAALRALANNDGSSLGSLNAANITSGTLPVNRGGTGDTTHTANTVLLGNGTSPLLEVAPSTSGNVLTSNGTTWTSATPLNAALARYDVHPAQWIVNWDANTLATTSGSGNASNVLTRLVMLLTGTTTNSRAQREAAGVGSNDILMGGPSQGAQVIDFSRQVTIGFSFYLVSSSGTTSDVYFRLGTSAANSGTLANRGVAIRVANLTLTGLTHNGTTLNTSATLKTVVVNELTWVVIQSDGAGNVAFYIDGTLAATLTGGPTSGTAVSTFAAEALNGATAAQTRVHINQPRIRIN